MGIRPSMYILVGIDNIVENDPRHVKVVDYEDLEKPIKNYWKSEKGYFDDSDNKNFANKSLSDIIYNPENSSEYALDNIIGLIIDKLEYDSNFIRAWATIYKDFYENGWKRIPTLKKDDHEIMFKGYNYNQEDINCNRFVDSIFENVPELSRNLWAKTKHYLLQCGWNVAEEDLRYLIVWDWG